MAKSQCPFPDDLNPLSPNGFQLIIDKLPGVTFFTQEVPVPGLSLPAATQESPFSTVHTPGDKIEFEQLTVQFLVDEHMNNWKAVYKWMTGLGFPSDNNEYTEFIDSQKNYESELQKMYSDARLIIYGNNLTPIQTIHFTDIYPESLGSLAFTNITQDVQYLTCTATFNYTYYKFD